jgi:hypothetical protein
MGVSRRRKKRSMSELGPFSEVELAGADFRFTPESGLKSDIAPCPKSANSGLKSDIAACPLCAKTGSLPLNQKAARRRLFNSTLMIVDQATASNAGFDFRR